MQIAVVIVNYRTPELVLTCLRAVATERTALPALKAIVVDNLSGDHSVDLLSEALASPEFSDWVEFLPLPHNGGFGWGNNEAILGLLRDPAAPEAVLLLNPDTQVQPGAIEALSRDLAARPDAAAVGAQLLNEDGTLAGSAFRFPSIGRELLRGSGIDLMGHLLGIEPTLVPFGQRGPVDWVTGACVLIRSAALRQTGLFDTGFFLYFEEVELMHRFNRHGWRCYHCPESRVVHVAGASTGVVDGRNTARAAPPDYLFVSRRRYFALTGSRLEALAADLAWLSGAAIAGLVGAIMPARRIAGRSAELAALLRLGLGARPSDARPAITPVNGLAGSRPAWMI